MQAEEEQMVPLGRACDATRRPLSRRRFCRVEYLCMDACIDASHDSDYGLSRS